jgi:hypothetical protein
MDFAAAVRVLLLKNTEDVFPPEGFHPPVYSPVFSRLCVTLAVFQVQPCSMKEM